MKLTGIYNKISAIIDSADEKIGILEEQRDGIEEKAIDADRDMTEREEERYDAIEEQIDCIRECIDNLEYALSSIEEYADWRYKKMFRLADYIDQDSLDKLDYLLHDTMDEEQIFKDAFGSNYDKYYIPYISRSSYTENIDNSSILDFYINAISSIEYEFGELDELKNDLNYQNIHCYKNGKLVATIDFDSGFIKIMLKSIW